MYLFVIILEYCKCTLDLSEHFAYAINIYMYLYSLILWDCTSTLALSGHVLAPAVNRAISVFHSLLLCMDLIIKTATKKNRQ